MLKRLLPVLALCCVPAHASTICYSDSGAFSGSTPSPHSRRQSEAWTFTFQVDSNPAVFRVTCFTLKIACIATRRIGNASPLGLYGNHLVPNRKNLQPG